MKRYFSFFFYIYTMIKLWLLNTCNLILFCLFFKSFKNIFLLKFIHFWWFSFSSFYSCIILIFFFFLLNSLSFTLSWFLNFDNILKLINHSYRKYFMLMTTWSLFFLCEWSKTSFHNPLSSDTLRAKLTFIWHWITCHGWT